MRPYITLLSCIFAMTQAVASTEAPTSAPDTPKKEIAKEAAKEGLKVELKPQPNASAKAIAAERALADQIQERLVAQRKKLANPSAFGPYGKVASLKTKARPAKPVAVEPEIIPHATHWSYEGEGAPTRWGRMNPEWATCASGSRQSPIDIRDGIRVDLEPIAFDYHPSRFNVVDNGHTIQVNMGPRNYMTITGKRYELVQFHFHRPAEEHIDGRGFEMVAHLVHKSVDGKLAVVAVLIDSGQPNDPIQKVWNNLPLEKNEPVAPTSLLNLSQLLPERREYYTYMGSLTTPPCTEGVLWIVLKEPIQASDQQIGIFSRFYPMNARPIQASGDRIIKESN